MKTIRIGGNKRGLNSADFTGVNRVAFLKQLRRLVS